MLAGINPLMMGTKRVVAYGSWNPSHKHANIVLSDSNRTATLSGSSGHKAVYGTGFRSTGKLYAEVTVFGSLSNGIAVGLAISSATTSSSLYDQNTTVSLYSNNGRIYVRASAVEYSAATPVSGSTVQIAVDFAADTFWLGVLNNWGPSRNPATNTGGISMSSVVGAKAVAFSGWSSGDGGTMNTGNAPFVNSIPTGFDPWDS